jgi:hypothetical protein
MPITTLKQREASSSTPFGITPIPDGVISDVDRAMTLGVYWFGSAPPPSTDTDGIDVTIERDLNVLFEREALVFIMGSNQLRMAFDARSIGVGVSTSALGLIYANRVFTMGADARMMSVIFIRGKLAIIYH